MKVQYYKNDTTGFLNDTLDILLENEAQNAIIISNAQNKRNKDTSEWFFETVKDISGSVVLSAMCTPPWNIVIYETDNRHNEDAINLLAKELFDAGYILPGVTGEKAAAESFADCYAKLANKNKRVHMNLNAMRLDNLSDVNFAPGYLREITEDDLCFLPYWANAFAVDCNIRGGEIMESYDYFKNQFGKNIEYVWIDKIPASIAGSVSRMINGAKIARVYTPPFNRNKGYSTSCVWHLSKMLLDEGNKFVSLFADADYPVSNKVYQKIGFRDVCLYREIRFE